MSLKITYLAHSTTTDNEAKISTGHNPGELSKLGRQQAIELREHLKDKRFDIIFCSDLNRAVVSAKLFFPNAGEIIQDKRLRECNYGDMNGKPTPEVEAYDYLNQKYPNGESYPDVEKRMKDFLKDALKDYPNNHIAIVSHKATQLALDKITKKISWQETIKQDWRNTSSWQPGWEYEITKEDLK